MNPAAPVLTLEHERKFLPAPGWEPTGVYALPGYSHSLHITQSYLPSTGSWAARVRRTTQGIGDPDTLPPGWEPLDPLYQLILKQHVAGCTSRELATTLTPAEYAEWSAACPPPLRKLRHHVLHGEHTWHVDQFLGELAPLCLLEVELPAADHPLDLPVWAGTEVTRDREYGNQQLHAAALEQAA